MFQAILNKIFGTRNERELKRFWPMVSKIGELEPQMQAMSDRALKAKTAEFRERIERGEALDDLMIEAFAVAREASVRALGMRPFDVQILGAIVLHRGRIAEMKTGEGKTLCATLPMYLNALSGKGTHLVTVNDYLAKRDAEWMGVIYQFLGLSVGVIVQGMDSEERYRAYRSDITYGQNNEFGFDYLRDNMKLELEEMVQRKHHYAIVDEVDSILVDEARTPLIISGPSEKPTETYQLANNLVPKLEDEAHYTVDLKSKQVMLSDDGVKRVEELLQLENLYDPKNIELVHHLTQALKAHVTMKRDIDYVVRDDQVMIVDEFTGRLMSGRRWSDGLHQAVEAKEGVEIRQENQTLATITFQNYFRMYEKLAGMTGTADTEAVEFKRIYNLDVSVIPTNMPMIRADNADVIFTTEKGKFRAVCDEIEECVSRGQPVLCGTASIAKSEKLGSYLSKRKIAHHVLNAKHHEREAAIVAQAGRCAGVTISTNMAGRGTDIVLGGNPEFLAAEEAGTKDPEDPEYQEQLEYFNKTCSEEKEKVLAAGGLHVLGTERHESRRIDNQLRGRSGRQGDPGSSRFYVSLEDDLMKRFGGERMQSIMSRVGMREDDAIEGTLVARAIENAQKKVEGFHFDIRKHLLEYDDVMNKQREVIYTQRAKILNAEEVEETFQEMIPDIIEELILARASEKEPPSKWNVAGMFKEYYRIFGEEPPADRFIADQESARKGFAQEIFDYLLKRARTRYEDRKARFGPERMVKLQRVVYLQACDHYWKEHLANMDHLKEGIGLRGYGQRNPLHEYQREAFEAFSEMLAAIKTSVLQNILIPELPTEEEILELEEREREMLRQREREAQTVHEDIAEATGGPVDGAAAEEGLNRRQRRRRQAISKAVEYSPVEEDYRPTAAPVQHGAATAKAAKRKKSKAARKARKRSR